MVKKFIDFCVLIISSGVLFHRSTFIGVLCGSWVYFGAVEVDSVFGRMLTLDLYLFIVAFLLLYRVLFIRVYTQEGDLDLQTMGICLLGDFAWAVVAMVCIVPFYMTFEMSDTIGSAKVTPEMKALTEFRMKLGK